MYSIWYLIILRLQKFGNIFFRVIHLNEELIKNNFKDLVRNSVEETLNALLDHEADELVKADKYERSGNRKGYRPGHYERNFSTTSGDVKLKVPKLKGIQFETAIIARYKRRECSVEEALLEIYLAGVSVRRVEDITEALWGSKVSRFPRWAECADVGLCSVATCSSIRLGF